MSNRMRWALAGIGVLIIVGAGVLIGTGRDEAATPVQLEQNQSEGREKAPAGASGATPATRPEAPTPASGGAAPAEKQSPTAPAGSNSGGAAPAQESGGAAPVAGVISPVLTAGRPRTVRATKGEVVTLRARAEKAATLHVHGYDRTLRLEPGKVGSLRLRATIDGDFEIELHYTGSESSAGTLRVSP